MIFLYMSHNFEASENLLLGEFVKKMKTELTPQD